MFQAIGPPSIDIRPSCWVKVGRASNFTVLHNLSELSSSRSPVQTHLKLMTYTACLLSGRAMACWPPFHHPPQFLFQSRGAGNATCYPANFSKLPTQFPGGKSGLRHILMVSRIVKPVISVWSPCGLLVLCDNFLWCPDVSQFIHFTTLLE